LKTYYNPNSDKYLDIYYFNDKKSADGYLKNQLSDNISEKQKNALFKHFIARYFYNPSNKESGLAFMHN